MVIVDFNEDFVVFIYICNVGVSLLVFLPSQGVRSSSRESTHLRKRGGRWLFITVRGWLLHVSSPHRLPWVQLSLYLRQKFFEW